MCVSVCGGGRGARLVHALLMLLARHVRFFTVPQAASGVHSFSASACLPSLLYATASLWRVLSVCGGSAPQHPLLCRQHPQQLLRGRRVLALVRVRRCKVAGGEDRIRMCSAHRPLPFHQHRHQHLLGLAELASYVSACSRPRGRSCAALTRSSFPALGVFLSVLYGPGRVGAGGACGGAAASSTLLAASRRCTAYTTPAILFARACLNFTRNVCLRQPRLTTASTPVLDRQRVGVNTWSLFTVPSSAAGSAGWASVV